MQPDMQKGQLFSSAAPASTAAAETEKPSYQPAKELPGEGAEYDAMVFDMAAAGFDPIHWTRPKADLRFTMRQTTIPAYCRAIRLTMVDGSVEQADLARALFKSSIVRIGDVADPDEDYIETWLGDLRTVGIGLVDRAYQHLCHPSEAVNRDFDKSKTYDPGARCFSFKLPRSVLPKKTAAAFPEADLSFTMRELSFAEMSASADACDDPDDGYAIRVLRAMWAITSIGGKPLGHSAEDLLYRRRWLAQIGHQAWVMIAGTWTRMHEVDRGLVDRFLGAASAPA